MNIRKRGAEKSHLHARRQRRNGAEMENKISGGERANPYPTRQPPRPPAAMTTARRLVRMHIVDRASLRPNPKAKLGRAVYKNHDWCF